MTCTASPQTNAASWKGPSPCPPRARPLAIPAAARTPRSGDACLAPHALPPLYNAAIPTYNPDQHHRRSIRLQGYDHSLAGAYFVTICTYQRERLFGDIGDGAMYLNDLGKTVQTCWEELPAHFKNLVLDASIIMPNHVHAIAILVSPIVGARHASPLCPASPPPSPLHAITHPRSPLSRQPTSTPTDRGGEACLAPTQPVPPHEFSPQSLGAIVASLKSASIRRINIFRRTPGVPIWQRNYYEHIIRGDSELDRIREYISTNPSLWAEDELNPSHTPLTRTP